MARSPFGLMRSASSGTDSYETSCRVIDRITDDVGTYAVSAGSIRSMSPLLPTCRMPPLTGSPAPWPSEVVLVLHAATPSAMAVTQAVLAIDEDLDMEPPHWYVTSL